MEALRKRVLQMFAEIGRDTLDLHVLFEAAGNDPAERNRVLDAVEALVEEGFLNPEGNDFYSLTDKGRRSLRPA